MNNFSHQQHTFTPMRVRSGFGATPKPPQPDSQPDTPVVDPDDNSHKLKNELENIDPALSGSLADVPDGWIASSQAYERLSLAGIHVDNRRVRNLCSRNELENIKVRNEKNQPQYFINPTALDQYIDQNRSAGSNPISRINHPDMPDIPPDQEQSHLNGNVEKSDPALSGLKDSNPDGNLERGAELAKNVEIRMLKDQLQKTEKMVEYLQDELIHRRTTDHALGEVIGAFRLNAENSSRRERPEQSEKFNG